MLSNAPDYLPVEFTFIVLFNCFIIFYELIISHFSCLNYLKYQTKNNLNIIYMQNPKSLFQLVNNLKK